MKLKTHRAPGWWTSCLRAVVVLLGLVAGAAVTSAQEGTPFDDREANDVEPVLYSNRLFQVVRTPAEKEVKRDECERVWLEVDPGCEEGAKVKPGDLIELSVEVLEDFVIMNSDEFYARQFTRVGSRVPVEQVLGSAVVNGELLGVRLRVLVTPLQAGRIQEAIGTDGGGWKNVTHVVRLKHCRAEHAAKILQIAFSMVSCVADTIENTVVLRAALRDSIGELVKVEAALRKLDVPSNRATVEPTAVYAHPDTPAAKQLLEQLGAQESAAAAMAATIRQLQANGQAEQNRQRVAEHQRKLRGLLSTAFELKLQSEELQVKELKARLSRLERQIGQRKELREKIIARRAGELIAGEELKWNVSDTSSKQGRPVDANYLHRNDEGTSVLQITDETSSQTASGTTRLPQTHDKGIVIDLYGGAQVLPKISKNRQHTRLLQTLNAMKGVVTNFREVQVDDPTTIVTAIVRDPSQRCLREAQQTQKESALKEAINSALEAAGIVSVRWEETVESESGEKAAK